MKLRIANNDDWRRVKEYFFSLPKIRDDKRITYRISIDEVKPTRSLEQNSRYWAMLTRISQCAPEHQGGEWYAPEVWHDYFCRRFLGVVPGPYGTGARKESHKLGVGEFAEFMEQVEAWAYTTLPGFEFHWEAA